MFLFGAFLLLALVVGAAGSSLAQDTEPAAPALTPTLGPPPIAPSPTPAKMHLPIVGRPPLTPKDPKPGPIPTRVRALPDRQACEITFPRLNGYRYDLGGEQLTAVFNDDSRMILSTADIPTWTENAPIIGESSIQRLDDLKRRRVQEVAFLLGKLVLEKYFRDDEENTKPWLFPQLLGLVKRWLQDCLILKDNTFPQLLLLNQFAYNAAERIYQAIVSSTSGHKTLKPILRPYDTIGSTCYVDFDTTRPTYETDPQKCHISHVVADTESWEQKLAQTLEEMPEVVCYVKNHNLGFAIPYTIDGDEKNYIPDFIVRFQGADGELINLIIEVTGEKKKEKLAKVATAKNLWVPAVNNHTGFGKWAFLEITDPWDAQNLIRAFMNTMI
jgi:type III restriction enzyme